MIIRRRHTANFTMIGRTRMNVGLAIKAAIERGREHQRLCPRRLHVRFMTQWGGDLKNRTGVVNDVPYDSPGLLIRAAFSASTQRELDAQGAQCERIVPWEELDTRAGDLVGLVDECVAAAEAALGLKARA